MRLNRALCWTIGGYLFAFAGVVVAKSGAAEAVLTPATASKLITSVGQFWKIPETEKQERYAVRFEFIVSYHDPYWKLLWGRSEGFDTYWPIGNFSQIIPAGRHILIEGTVVPAKGQNIDDEKITLLPESSPVEVLSSAGDMANANRFDARTVSFEAYVNHQVETDANHLTLSLAVAGQPVFGRVLLPSDSPVPQLEGALVRLRGVYVPTYDSSGKMNHLDVWIGRKDDVEVLSWIESDVRFNLPVTAVEKLAVAAPEKLVRVVGVVQAQQPGKSLTIRDETGQVTLKTAQTRLVDVGERIEAIGYPTVRGFEMNLLQSLFRGVRGNVSPEINLGLPKLRLAEQVKDLRPAEASRGYPVRLNGAVTWSHPEASFFFLQDVSGGIKINRPMNSAVTPAISSRVEVRGVSRRGEFAPEVVAETIADGGIVGLPDARSVTLEQAMTGIEEAKWISMSGYVRAIGRDDQWCRLELTTSAGEFTAMLPWSSNVEKLPGAVVRLSGVCTAMADASHQLTEIKLWVSSEDHVQIEEPAPLDPFTVPMQTIENLRGFSTLLASGRRVQISGVVLAHAPGRYLRLENGGETLLVYSRDTLPLAIGDRVNVVGFPGRQSGRIVLRESVYRRIAFGAEPEAMELHEPKAIDAGLDGHLIRIEGTLLEMSKRADGVRLTMRTGNLSFEALLDLPRGATAPNNWAKGSRVTLTGVYEIQFDEYLRPDGFSLRLRTPLDVRVLFRPSWWTAEHAWIAAGLLAVGTLMGLAWAVALRRRVRQQTSEIRAQWEKGTRLETELARASKLESLGLLAGGIAHDFNNLLMVMMGNVTLVLHDRHLDAENRTYLREVEKATLRGRDLTQQLLTFARGGAPIRSAVDLGRIARDAAGFAVHDSNVSCEFDLAPDLWPADADKGQMAQVMHNVILNAVQAMPTGGVVKIALRNVQVAAFEIPALDAGRYLKMTITDHGTGISPEHLARIFDPYFTTKQHGSGLGLATVYSIVNRHQGHLAVTSKLGEGTTFQFWLPAAESRAETRPPIPLPVQRRGGRVLFMDDEVFIRNIAVTLLKRIQCEPTVVSDGAAAVAAFAIARNEGRPYDVVILDLTVPGGMGGAEAMAQIRELDPTVRAIVSSGYSSNPVMANYQDYGFKAAVPKPYEVEELMNAVQALLRDEPYMGKAKDQGTTRKA